MEILLPNKINYYLHNLARQLKGFDEIINLKQIAEQIPRRSFRKTRFETIGGFLFLLAHCWHRIVLELRDITKDQSRLCLIVGAIGQ